jgi:hypothetical protein
MRAFWDSKQRSDAMAVIQPFFVNQFTITNAKFGSLYTIEPVQASCGKLFSARAAARLGRLVACRWA